MSSSSNSPAKTHAIITLEPLKDEDLESGKHSLNFLATNRTYHSGPSAELQRQQRRRLMIHIFGWFLVVLLMALAALIVYFIISRK